MSRCELSQEMIDYVTECTLIRARQAVRRVRNLGDVKDVQQDLLLDILQRLPNFDGERADIKTFISRLVDNKVASMIDTFRRARRRGEGVGPSVDDWVLDEDGEWIRRDGVMDAELLRAHRGVDSRSAEETVNLKADVAAVMAKLPEELRELCVQLQTHGPWELIQGGKASAVLYKQMAEIREAFREAQLDLYQ
ncbi:MAG: hypothetical protein FWD61_00195 [Phycisphaerales bacterium]|nr:hypothetical protein [Phycisphaerales bacterium]